MLKIYYQINRLIKENCLISQQIQPTNAISPSISQTPLAVFLHNDSLGNSLNWQPATCQLQLWKIHSAGSTQGSVANSSLVTGSNSRLSQLSSHCTLHQLLARKSLKLHDLEMRQRCLTFSQSQMNLKNQDERGKMDRDKRRKKKWSAKRGTPREAERPLK